MRPVLGAILGLMWLESLSVDSIQAGILLATAVLESGAAKQKLEEFVRATNV